MELSELTLQDCEICGEMIWWDDEPHPQCRPQCDTKNPRDDDEKGEGETCESVMSAGSKRERL